MQLCSNYTLDSSLDGDNDCIEFLFPRGPKSTKISPKSDKGKCIYEANTTCAYLFFLSDYQLVEAWPRTKLKIYFYIYFIFLIFCFLLGNLRCWWSHNYYQPLYFVLKMCWWKIWSTQVFCGMQNLIILNLLCQGCYKVRQNFITSWLVWHKNNFIFDFPWIFNMIYLL